MYTGFLFAMTLALGAAVGAIVGYLISAFEQTGEVGVLVFALAIVAILVAAGVYMTFRCPPDREKE